MSKTIRNIHNKVPYLLPASLLTISGVLLMGLLYYPAPLAYGAGQTPITPITEQKYWRTLTDGMLAVLMTDAIQQLRNDRQNQTPPPRYPRNGEADRNELTTSLRVAPLIIENSEGSRRPVLIRL